MANHYDKIADSLKEIRKMQRLIAEGCAKPHEKQGAFHLAKEAAVLFTDEIFRRKAEKQNRVTIWSAQSKDGFVSAEESSQLDGWVALLNEYLERRKTSINASSEKTHIRSVVDGKNQHIFITEKGSSGHAHLIVDGDTGEIRADKKDKAPHELIKSIRAEVELKTGDTVQIADSRISFIEPKESQPDVRVYPAKKDSYFVLEIYNNGDEDLENFEVKAGWMQPPPECAQERVLQQFNDINDYLVTASSRSLNMLATGARVYAKGVPSISVDKQLKITVTCMGMKSGKELKRVFTIETPNKY